MQITFLGTSSGMAVPHRNPSSIAMEIGKEIVLLDAGEGTARQMAKFKLHPNQIQSIIISHTHPDHAAGIIGLLQYMHLNDREEDIDIYMPEKIIPGFHTIFPLFNIYPKKWPFVFQLKPIKQNIFHLRNGLHVEAIQNDHVNSYIPYAQPYGFTPQSYSFILWKDDAAKIIYSSDIKNFDHFAKNNSDIELLISECTHVSINDIEKAGRSMRSNKIILTHISPEFEKSNEGTLDIMTMAYDGMTLSM